ncbi:hypothetical protein GW750_02705 [bacterium]|nr:hypothetical protein [bacterium]
MPLLSLDNSYNTQDIQDFDERIHKELAKQIDNYDVTYSLEPKFDGISVELIYKN